MQSANEELQSSNEELESGNEELETSREELQSSNEELHNVNAELEGKVEELAQANNDINNLMASTAIGIVFIDERQRVQRFTPAVTDIVPLIESDIGRPLSDIGHKLDYERLAEDLEEVLRRSVRKEREVLGRDGRWYLTRITPYRISENRVRGAVLAFIDLTDKQRLALLGKLMSAVDQCVSMVAITDLDGRIEYVNDVFAEATGYHAREVVGENAATVGLDSLSDGDREAMRTLRGGKVWRNEIRYRRKDGAEVRAAAFVAPVRSGAGEISHAVAYLDEVPEKH